MAVIRLRSNTIREGYGNHLAFGGIGVDWSVSKRKVNLAEALRRDDDDGRIRE